MGYGKRHLCQINNSNSQNFCGLFFCVCVSFRSRILFCFYIHFVRSIESCWWNSWNGVDAFIVKTRSCYPNGRFQVAQVFASLLKFFAMEIGSRVTQSVRIIRSISRTLTHSHALWSPNEEKKVTLPCKRIHINIFSMTYCWRT